MSTGLGREDIRALLDDLSEELAARGARAELFLVGGAALAVAYDATRATRDLDAVFVPSDVVRQAAAAVAEREGLADDWLNDAVKGFLPDASVEAVLCTDAIQFPDEAVAYDEIRRVLKPGGRVVLTCWEPLDRNDERLSLRVRRANLGAGLHQAGFRDVEVRDRPSWLAREHALWEEAVTLDPGDDRALRSLHAEGVKSLQWTALLRRVLAVATNPQ